MHHLSDCARPFMGPNLYITPPCSFTQFHQDGYGTVDSGHLCLSGCNEVVMLRRLPESHKKNVLRLLHNNHETIGKSSYDPLYGLPHGDGYTNKTKWPSLSVIEKWRSMK